MITLRPHHLLCNYCFIGSGYSTDFTNNFKKINDQLCTNPSTKIAIENQLDNICSKCPNNLGASCTTQDKVDRLDSMHSRALGITTKQFISWSDAVALIHSKIDEATFNQICSECEWYNLDICRNKLFG